MFKILLLKLIININTIFFLFSMFCYAVLLLLFLLLRIIIKNDKLKILHQRISQTFILMLIFINNIVLSAFP